MGCHDSSEETQGVHKELNQEKINFRPLIAFLCGLTIVGFLFLGHDYVKALDQRITKEDAAEVQIISSTPIEDRETRMIGLRYRSLAKAGLTRNREIFYTEDVFKDEKGYVYFVVFDENNKIKKVTIYRRVE